MIIYIDGKEVKINTTFDRDRITTAKNISTEIEATVTELCKGSPNKRADIEARLRECLERVMSPKIYLSLFPVTDTEIKAALDNMSIKAGAFDKL